MDYLLECGVSEEVLNKITVNNSELILTEAEWNIERVVSSIEYLCEIGIENIDKILINRFDLVLRGREVLMETTSKLDVHDLVSKINDDIKYAYYFDLY